jgi:hypothetical protein
MSFKNVWTHFAAVYWDFSEMLGGLKQKILGLTDSFKWKLVFLATVEP